MHAALFAATMTFGITMDSLRGIDQIAESLGRFSHKPTTRIVFDELVPASDYAAGVGRVGQVSFVMGGLLDSSSVDQYSVRQYRDRAVEYVETLGRFVDVWEVGNELNGEWLGATADVVAKASAAYDVVKSHGGMTALTLYYNEDCWAQADHEMFTWTEANIPDAMKRGLDYVLVSFYEDDCNGIRPDWPAVFARLGRIFPDAQLGFGEVGTTDSARKIEVMRRYYGMASPHPRFIGGYFWWYGRQDLVPATTPYWSALDALVRAW